MAPVGSKYEERPSSIPSFLLGIFTLGLVQLSVWLAIKLWQRFMRPRSYGYSRLASDASAMNVDGNAAGASENLNARTPLPAVSASASTTDAITQTSNANASTSNETDPATNEHTSTVNGNERQQLTDASINAIITAFQDSKNDIITTIYSLLDDRSKSPSDATTSLLTSIRETQLSQSKDQSTTTQLLQSQHLTLQRLHEEALQATQASADNLAALTSAVQAPNLSASITTADGTLNFDHPVFSLDDFSGPREARAALTTLDAKIAKLLGKMERNYKAIIQDKQDASAAQIAQLQAEKAASAHAQEELTALKEAHGSLEEQVKKLEGEKGALEGRMEEVGRGYREEVERVKRGWKEEVGRVKKAHREEVEKLEKRIESLTASAAAPPPPSSSSSTAKPSQQQQQQQPQQLSWFGQPASTRRRPFADVTPSLFSSRSANDPPPRSQNPAPASPDVQLADVERTAHREVPAREQSPAVGEERYSFARGMALLGEVPNFDMGDQSLGKEAAGKMFFKKRGT